MRKIVSFAATILGGVLLVGALTVFQAFSTRLEVTTYTITSPKIAKEVRLAVLSDLHGCFYGPGQQELVEAIHEAAPHGVLYVGDMLDDKMSNAHSLTLFAALQKRYPAYYVAGNHEFWNAKRPSYRGIVEAYGIEVLAGKLKTVTLNGQQLAIAGVEDPARGRQQFLTQMRAVGKAVNPKVFTLLLSHRPEKWEVGRATGADLTLSGHAHGGQWRVPWLLEQGLLAPNQGLFPRYTSGQFTHGTQNLIVSRGLAKESTKWVPRIFNRPQLVIVSLQPQADAE